MEIRLASAGTKLKHTLPTTESNELKDKINLLMKADQARNHTSKRKKWLYDHANGRGNHTNEHYPHNDNIARKSNHSGDDNEGGRNEKETDADDQSNIDHDCNFEVFLRPTIHKRIKIVL